jgi:hypothetical protein
VSQRNDYSTDVRSRGRPSCDILGGNSPCLDVVLSDTHPYKAGPSVRASNGRRAGGHAPVGSSLTIHARSAGRAHGRLELLQNPVVRERPTASTTTTTATASANLGLDLHVELLSDGTLACSTTGAGTRRQSPTLLIVLVEGYEVFPDEKNLLLLERADQAELATLSVHPLDRLTQQVISIMLLLEPAIHAPARRRP